MKIIKSKIKKMRLLTKQQKGSYENCKICYTYKEKFENKCLEDKKYCKVRGHCHYIGEYKTSAYSIYNFKHSVSKKIPIVFYDGSN